MNHRSFLALSLAAALLPACGPEAAGTSGSATGGGGSGGSSTTSAGGSGGTGSGGAPDLCVATFDDTTVHLAVSATLESGEDRSMCLRWTAPEDISIHGFVGSLGPAMGHHALLIGHATPSAPDGLAPCNEAELMDAQKDGAFSMLAGVSYESDGIPYEFPSQPVQVGLFVPAGTQLILDAHFLNTGAASADGCASIDLHRGKPVIAKLQFRTVLPETQYTLVVPAHGTVDVAYEEPVGGAFRVAAASSHMHQGGTHFRMSVKETDKTLYETSQWAEPQPALFDKEKVVLGADQTLKLECSFENSSDTDQYFPTQMCVGGMYLLTCGLPGAC